MSSNDAMAAIERLAVRNDVALGRLSRADQLAVLAFASLSIPASAVCSEAEVNEALKRWLADGGAMLRVDHVELRRTLIDFGLWTRDGFGRAYRRAERFVDPQAAGLVATLAGADAARRVREARQRAIDERAARKARAAERDRSAA